MLDVGDVGGSASPGVERSKISALQALALGGSDRQGDSALHWECNLREVYPSGSHVRTPFNLRPPAVHALPSHVKDLTRSASRKSSSP